MGHTEPRADRLAYRVVEAAAATGLTRTAIFEAIRRDELKSFRAGKRRLILVDDLRHWLQRLASASAA